MKEVVFFLVFPEGNASQGAVVMNGCVCADEALQTLEGSRWRQSPGDFGIGGRYPVKEVFAAAAATWQGESSSPHLDNDLAAIMHSAEPATAP